MKLKFLCHAVCVAILLSAAPALSAEYPAMQGVESADAVFDFRIGEPDTALGHLNLIQSMIDDPAMVIKGREPRLAIVFIGPSVKLISTDTSPFGEEQKKTIAAIAEKIDAMSKSGVRFEICMTSVPAFNVDPDSILPQVDKVGNGWISLIGYQHRGYAMIADF